MPRCRLPRYGGFSLIEVLVTMVILSFGMLGVAGLLVGGVSNAASSEAMAKATQLAGEMADRMRANPVVALSATSEYLTPTDAGGPLNVGWTSIPPAASSTSIAKLDLRAWLLSVQSQLPSGQGKITNAVGGGGRTVTIAVRWSNCLGTLSDTEKTSCGNQSGVLTKSVQYELRL